MPAAMPIAAEIQTAAAVVRPRTAMPWWMIAPAPRKPTPVTDLRRDARRVDRSAGARELGEAVGGDQGEDRRAHADQHVRAHAGGLVAGPQGVGDGETRDDQCAPAGGILHTQAPIERCDAIGETDEP